MIDFNFMDQNKELYQFQNYLCSPLDFIHKNKFINMDFGPKRLSNNKVTISLLYQPIIQYIESLYDNDNRFCQIKNVA